MTEHEEHKENPEHEEHKEHRDYLESHPRKQFKLGNAEKTILIIGVLLIILFIYNTGKISNLSSVTGNVIGGNSILPTVSASEIIPVGIPKIYGEELGVKYSDVSASTPQKADLTIGAMANLDKTIDLSGPDLTRYIDIAGEISCEFCCGVDSIIRSDGSAACGCAHSFAMRGLAKYLITEHANEFTDDEILEELGKWKVLFFPGKHETKASVLKSQGIEINYINLASNKYRGIEKGVASGGGMVGGC